MISDPAVPPGSPAPKSRSGCLTALYIVLGVGAVLLVLLVIAGWLFVRSEQGQRLVGVASEGLTMAREAMRAPGTDALRDSGCAQALVLSSARLRQIAGMMDMDLPGSLATGDADIIVLCQVDSADAAPACGDIARVYAGAVPEAPDRFAVMVQTPGPQGTACEGIFARDGTQIGAIEPESPPDRP